MAITVSTVSNTQTFSAWLSTTNRLANLMTQNTVTADSSNGGSITTGNSFVNGHFGSDFLYVSNTLIGGNVSSNGVLKIQANVAFTNGSANIITITANSTTSNLRFIGTSVDILPEGNISIGGNTTIVTSSNLIITGANILFSASPINGDLSIANAVTLSGNLIFNSAVIIANNGFGTNGQILYSNGTSMYWGILANNGLISNNGGLFVNANNGLTVNTSGVFVTQGTGTVVNATGVHVDANNGLVSNSTGLFVNANNGITANSTGVFVTQGTGTVVNATGVHINSTYIATISSNSAAFANASSTNTFTVGTASYFVSNGNLGVGNSAPAHKLRVEGSLSLLSGIHANGSLGSSGQVLTSNGTGVYWSTAAGGVTSVSSGNGLTGGPITSTGTLSVLANNGITANSTGVFVTQGTGTVVNATGVHVNSTYIGTLTANNSNNFNGQPASFYTNATNLATGTVPTARLGSGTANSINFLSGDQTYKTAVTSVSSGNGLTGGPITSTGTLSVLANNGITANSTGVHVNANNGITANSTGVFVTQGTGTVVNATGVHVNTSYITTIDANSAAFANASSTNTFTVGTASYFVANGNLGVGNSAPAHKLRVEGSLSILSGLHANGSLGSNGQVLTSNGAGIYWANAASGGGSGQFNTNLTNSVGFAANSTLSAAFTAPATAGFRYIVYSIHVTNIGGANTFINGEFSGTTYANISFATTVPVPTDSAVELLKMPKIMQPSDILRLGVIDNTALHATITYETQTSTNYFGVGVDITADATYTDLYTATGNAVLQSLLLSNDDGVYDVKARVVWTDGSNNIQGYYCYDLIIPADSTVELLEQAKFLQSGYKVRVYANVGGRLEAILAGRLI